MKSQTKATDSVKLWSSSHPISFNRKSIIVSKLDIVCIIAGVRSLIKWVFGARANSNG